MTGRILYGYRMEKGIAVVEQTEGVYAVSYTHLDVYKRQLPFCTEGRLGQSKCISGLHIDRAEIYFYLQTKGRSWTSSLCQPGWGTY